MLDRNGGFQSANHIQPAEAAVVFKSLERARKNVIAHANGNPDRVCRRDAGAAFEIWRGDADDRVSLLIQTDGASDSGVVGAETVHPQRVAQYRDWIAAGLFIFIGQKSAAAKCGHAENVEIICGDERDVELLGLG